MPQNNLGTVGGKPISQSMLDYFANTFAKDWSDSEVKFAHLSEEQS